MARYPGKCDESDPFDGEMGGCYFEIYAVEDDVKEKVVSFENLQSDKRQARLRDERRLASGEVTPQGLWSRYYTAAHYHL